MATAGDDILNFSGQITWMNFTLTNPYSSQSFKIRDNYNLNNSMYDGEDGEDTLSMTSLGDAIFIDGSTFSGGVSVQTILNVEVFLAGNGGDIINLAHEEFTYGDVTIIGGDGDDILWSNIGDDFINAGRGNDILDGGPGDDSLLGGDDNDQIYGGEGSDFLDGGDGDDILYGGRDLQLRELDKEFEDGITFPELQERTNIRDLEDSGVDSLGISGDNLSVDYQATATITFRDGKAGYNNSLAIYSIAEDGTIENVTMLWGNVKDAGKNVEHTIDIPVGEEGGDFGFFIIANGDRKNKGYDDLDVETEGNIQLIYDYGGANERLATVHDDGNMVTTVYNDGITEEVLKGPVYHTTPRGGDNSINPDGETHVVSGLAETDDGEVLRIGFEDLPNLGDADYEDVLFDLDVEEVYVEVDEPGDDSLFGGGGDDILYGEGGNDLLAIGEGADIAYGGSGTDRFRYDFYDTEVDIIKDFETGTGGDRLFLNNILEFDKGDDVDDFVRFVDNANGDTEIQVDTNGARFGEDFQTIGIFEGGIDSTAQELYDVNRLVL